MSLSQGIFPDKLKISKVTLIYETDEKTGLRIIDLFLFFLASQKILQRLISNRLFNYLTEPNILYEKQLGFSNCHSTKHAIIALVDKLLSQFEKNGYKLGIFEDLSKVIDTVNHEILLKKTQVYGVTVDGFS